MRKTVMDVSTETLHKHIVEVLGELLRRGNFREMRGGTVYGNFTVKLTKKEPALGNVIK